MPTSLKDMLSDAHAAVPKVGYAETAALMQDGALLVDVRDTHEVQATGLAAGAVHVTRGMLEFRADPESPFHDPAFNPERTVVLYCASGGRSALAGKVLQDMGYRDVRNLGGLKDWTEGGGAVNGA